MVSKKQKDFDKTDLKSKNVDDNKNEVEREEHEELNLGKDNLKPNEVREARGGFYGKKWTPN